LAKEKHSKKYKQTRLGWDATKSLVVPRLLHSPIKRCGRRWRKTSPIIPPTAKHSKIRWSPLPGLLALSGMNGKISVGTELMRPVAIAASRHEFSMS